MAGSIPRSATAELPGDLVTPPLPARATRRRTFGRVTGSAWVAGILLALIVGAAIAAPLIAPQDPYTQRLSSRLAPPFWLPNGLWDRPLGADDLGRDILSRVLY